MIFYALALEYSGHTPIGVLQFQVIVPLAHESVSFVSRMTSEERPKWSGWVYHVPTVVDRSRAIVNNDEVFFLDESVHHFLDKFPRVDEICVVREFEITEEEYKSFEFFMVPKDVIAKAEFKLLTQEQGPGKI